jgi:hypothetical protein
VGDCRTGDGVYFVVSAIFTTFAAQLVEENIINNHIIEEK